MFLKRCKLIGLLVLIVSCSKSKQQELSTNTSTILSVKNYQLKTLQVYTTAKDTELRLTKTSEQTFKPKVQPLETEVAIFVNPEKTFQEYLGIGGAITDASADKPTVRKIEGPAAEPLNLQALAGGAMLKRLLPIAGAFLGIFMFFGRRRRRRQS